jgi:hypothetical protein
MSAARRITAQLVGQFPYNQPYSHNNVRPCRVEPPAHRCAPVTQKLCVEVIRNSELKASQRQRSPLAGSGSIVLHHAPSCRGNLHAAPLARTLAAATNRNGTVAATRPTCPTCLASPHGVMLGCFANRTARPSPSLEERKNTGRISAPKEQHHPGT